jgi:hypothetical protein
MALVAVYCLGRIMTSVEHYCRVASVGMPMFPPLVTPFPVRSSVGRAGDRLDTPYADRYAYQIVEITK